MDMEDLNSKIGKTARVLYQKIEEGESALNRIISEKFSEGPSMDTEDLNLKIGEAAGGTLPQARRRGMYPEPDKELSC